MVVYNLSTGGAPVIEDIFTYRQNTSNPKGYPNLIFENSGALVKTDAETTNGVAGGNTPVYSYTTHTHLGYTYYQMTVNLDSGFTTFDPDPDWNIAQDTIFRKFGNVIGKLNVGDYLTIYNQSLPEKITAFNSDYTFDTDGVYDGLGGTKEVRQATYGSYTSDQGRSVDGLHGFQPVIVGDTELNAQTSGERFTIRLPIVALGKPDVSVC